MYVPCISVSSDTSVRVETRNPTPEQQRVRGFQRAGVGHRVQCVCGGWESEGQVPASDHVLQDVHRARRHPRYPPSSHSHETKPELKGQKTEEPNSKLEAWASRSIFNSPALLKGEWQLNISTSIDFLDSSEPQMSFDSPLLNEFEFALPELGQAHSTEDETIPSEWLYFSFC